MKSTLLLLAVAATPLACGKGQSYTNWTLEDLTPEQGLSIRLPMYEIPGGHESQRCYFFQMPDLNNGQPYWMNRFLIAQNPGSHHFNVFRVKTIVPPSSTDPSASLDPAKGVPLKIGDIDATLVDGTDDYKHSPCWASANWADWPLVTNSQNSDAANPYTDWPLPDHVAAPFHPGEMIMLQTHYVNATRQPAPYEAHVGLNMYFYKGSDTPMELGSLFATQQAIRICESNPNPTFSGTCRFPQGTLTITAANGHFHSRGRKFTMFDWDGQSTTQPPPAMQFYESDRWNDPPMMHGLNVVPPQGGGVWWNCEYQWQPPSEFTCADVNAKDPQQQNDCCYVFGGNTDVGEHCNVFLYYYPRVQSTDVFCN
jgi:hypothetical protein